jgi:predicted small lipoprotein YifL
VGSAFFWTAIVCSILYLVSETMKKTVILAAVIAAFALTACGNKEEAAAPVEAPAAAAVPATEATATEAPATEAPATEAPAAPAAEPAKQ